MLRGIDKGLVTQNEPGYAFDRQIKIRFLQQSASYLGADLAQHELAARYMQN
jgi:ABC-type microcin C transport system permease subunit YejB